MKLETKLRGALRFAQRRCERDGRAPPQITLAFLLKQWKRQCGRCALTHVPMEMSGPFGVTIDRINSNRGYLRNNVVLATHFANAAKSNTTVREFKNCLQQIWNIRFKGKTKLSPRQIYKLAINSKVP